jgi:NAD(P)-dependent dehydrogenase (short-subunit alcohol dehydrogenase family)
MTRPVTPSPRTALLTGATSGIGQWTALGLAKAGFRVIAVGRDEARARQLAEWVRGKHGAAEIETTLADLSLMAEVRRLAADVKARAPQLDLLVNNAGLMRKHRIETREGHELTLAVNHLAPFLLTRELLPLLASAARIVNVGSSSSDKAQIDPNDLEWKARPWSMYKAYGQSKLALMLTSFELARRLGQTPTVNVVHPGAVGTRIGNLGGGLGVAWALMKPVLLTPEAGARTTLHVATDPALASVTGRYFKKSAPAEPNPLGIDQGLAATVWARTEALLGLSET